MDHFQVSDEESSILVQIYLISERQAKFILQAAWIGEFYFSIAYVMLVWLQGGLQPFRWQKHDSVPHRGQPDVFDFQFELMKPWS